MAVARLFFFKGVVVEAVWTEAGGGGPVDSEHEGSVPVGGRQVVNGGDGDEDEDVDGGGDEAAVDRECTKGEVAAASACG